MPLVRYRIGDLVERRVDPYRTRYVVHGRAAECFATRSGRVVTTWQIDQCFAGLSGVAHYQLVERQHQPWLLRYVPDRPVLSLRDAGVLQQRLSDLLEAPLE